MRTLVREGLMRMNWKFILYVVMLMFALQDSIRGAESRSYDEFFLVREEISRHYKSKSENVRFADYKTERGDVCVVFVHYGSGVSSQDMYVYTRTSSKGWFLMACVPWQDDYYSCKFLNNKLMIYSSRAELKYGDGLILEISSGLLFAPDTNKLVGPKAVNPTGQP